MTQPLDRKVVVITGGAGRLGRAFAQCVAAHGGTAVVADLDGQAADAVALAVNDAGGPGRSTALSVDITSHASLTAAIDRVHERYGRIDAVVNSAYPRNAAYGRKFEEVTYDDFCDNVSMHLGGYFLTSQQFGRYFKAHGGGAIISVASIYGVVAPRFAIYGDSATTMPVEYAAIKAAVIHLTKYMAQYFKGSNIRVNCISPGGILDGQPGEFLRRYNSFAASKGMLDAADVSGALLFLLSDLSAFVTGQNIVVDDGWSL